MRGSGRSFMQSRLGSMFTQDRSVPDEWGKVRYQALDVIYWLPSVVKKRQIVIWGQLSVQYASYDQPSLKLFFRRMCLNPEYCVLECLCWYGRERYHSLVVGWGMLDSIVGILLAFGSPQVYFAVSYADRIVAYPCSIPGGVPTLLDSPFLLTSSAVSFLTIAPNGKVSAVLYEARWHTGVSGF